MPVLKKVVSLFSKQTLKTIQKYLALIEFSLFFFSLFTIIQITHNNHFKTLLIIFIVVLAFLYIRLYRKPLSEWSKANNPKLKLAASIYPGLAAVYLIFFKDLTSKSCSTWLALMRNQYKNGIANWDYAYLNQQYEVDVLTTFYVILIPVWIFIYFFFVTNESAASKEANEKLKSAIFRAPNPEMFGQYALTFTMIEQYILSTLREPDPTQQDYHNTFKKVLESICIFTNTYTKRETIYGANIMIYLENNFNDEALKDLKKSNEWVYLKNVSNENIVGILTCEDGLVYSNKKNESTERNIPSIKMPILKDQTGKIDRNMLLPGSCSAAAEGSHLFNDVTDIEKYFGHLFFP